MKRYLLFLSALAITAIVVSSSVVAQTVGDYRSNVSPKGFWDQASSWQRWDGSNWVTATSAPTLSNDVYILEGDTIDFGGSTSGNCKNLYIQAGGVLTSTNNNRSVTVNGGLIQCNGTIYCDGNTYRPMLQWAGTNCVLQGSGSVTLYRVRPASGGANYSFTFNMDAIILNGGVYSNNVSKVSYIIGRGATLTLNNSYFGGPGSKTGGVSNPYSILVDGTVNLLNTSVFNLNYTGTADSVVLTINGTVLCDRTTTFAVVNGTPALTVNGTFTTYGTFTLSNLLRQKLVGTGSFILGDGATLTLIGYPTGLDREVGPIQVPNCEYSPLAKYVFEGKLVDMVTGPDFPKSVVALTLRDTSGTLRLTNDVQIDSFLVFGANGKIITDTKILILGSFATVTGANDSAFVEGNVAATIEKRGKVLWPIGSGQKYLPVQLVVSAVSIPGRVSIRATSFQSEPPSIPLNPLIPRFDTYFKVTLLDYLEIQPDTLILSYAPKSIPEGIYHKQIQCLNRSENSWTKLALGSIDSVAGKIIVTDRISPTEFILIGPAGILQYEFASIDSTDFGPVVCGSTRSAYLAIYNAGNNTCVIDSVVSYSPEFLVTVRNEVLRPDSSILVPITFAPKNLGLRVGDIAVYSSGTISTVDSGEISGFGVEMKIRDARALAVGTEVFLKGIVTRTKGAYTFFQDSTGGMCIYGTRGLFYDSVASKYIAPGTELYIRGKLYEFFGLKEIRIIEDLIEWQKLGTKSLPEPELVTLADISARGENYESELVRIVNLNITGTTDVTFVASKNYNIVDPTDQSAVVKFRVQAARDCELVGVPIPTSFFTFEGVVGQYSSTGIGGYQLLPMYVSDIKIQTEVEEELSGIPSSFIVHPAFPNPFNPATSVRYGVPSKSTITVKVYSVLGQEVATLYQGVQDAGYHTVRWNAGTMASGIYFIKVSAQPLEGNVGTFNHVMKVVLMK